MDGAPGNIVKHVGGGKNVRRHTSPRTPPERAHRSTRILPTVIIKGLLYVKRTRCRARAKWPTSYGTKITRRFLDWNYRNAYRVWALTRNLRRRTTRNQQPPPLKHGLRTDYRNKLRTFPRT